MEDILKPIDPKIIHRFDTTSIYFVISVPQHPSEPAKLIQVKNPDVIGHFSYQGFAKLTSEIYVHYFKTIINPKLSSPPRAFIDHISLIPSKLNLPELVRLYIVESVQSS